MQTYDREREFNMLAGITGAGKSTFTGRYIKNYAENVIVLKHTANIDDAALSFLPEKTIDNWRQGAKPGAPVKCKIRIDKKNYRSVLQWIIAENYKNGLLVVDDATIFERFKLTDEMNEIVTIHRHYGIDLWMNYHGLSLLPIEQFVFVKHMILFMTSDNFQYKATKLPNMERLIAGCEEARANFNSGKVPLMYTPVIVKMRM